MDVPSQVTLVEVGPRDGLQNELKTIPTSEKINFIEQLASTGLRVIEATSFVSEKKIPQLNDATKVLQQLSRPSNISFPVLVPNLLGFEKALNAGANEIAIFISASETFSEKNLNCSIDESLKRYKEVTQAAIKNKIPIRAYISCVMGCPYEGPIEHSKVVNLSQQLFELGCREISLGDTIGVGTVLQTHHLITLFEQQQVSIKKLAFHFHDTYGQALVNINTALQRGIQTFDSSVAGLGGCPYAMGATGNVATEDLVYMLHGMNIETGVNLEKLLDVSLNISKQLQQLPRSKLGLLEYGKRQQAAK